jgi:hypothetical protein
MQDRKLESRSLFANAEDSMTRRTNARLASITAFWDEGTSLVRAVPISRPRMSDLIKSQLNEREINRH